MARGCDVGDPKICDVGDSNIHVRRQVKHNWCFQSSKDYWNMRKWKVDFMYQDIFLGHWYNSIRGWKPLVHMTSIVQSPQEGHYQSFATIQIH
jgi:hypothetical protein